MQTGGSPSTGRVMSERGAPAAAGDAPKPCPCRKHVAEIFGVTSVHVYMCFFDCCACCSACFTSSSLNTRGALSRSHVLMAYRASEMTMLLACCEH